MEKRPFLLALGALVALLFAVFAPYKSADAAIFFSQTGKNSSTTVGTYNGAYALPFKYTGSANGDYDYTFTIGTSTSNASALFLGIEWAECHTNTNPCRTLSGYGWGGGTGPGDRIYAAFSVTGEDFYLIDATDNVAYRAANIRTYASTATSSANTFCTAFAPSSGGIPGCNFTDYGGAPTHPNPAVYEFNSTSTQILSSGATTTTPFSFISGHHYKVHPGPGVQVLQTAAEPARLSSSGTAPYFIAASTLAEAWSGTPVASIEITFPANGTSTPDFDPWKIGYNYATSSPPTSPGFGRIEYSTSSSFSACTSSYLDDVGCLKDTEPLTMTTDPQSDHPVNKTHPLTQGTWYARAKLYDSASALVATSTSISFTIGAGQLVSGFFEFPTSTASSSEWVTTCDPNAGVFVNSICNLGLSLFVPKKSDFDRFSTLLSGLEHKPPIGWYTAIQTQMQNLTNGTTSIVLPSIPGFTDYLKNIFVWLIWLLFGFWIFHRFRTFEL